MNNRFLNNPNQGNGPRIFDKGIQTPKIRSEFYVRLFSFLQFEPQINFEGYEYFIKDSVSGIEFSAGLNGFGPGYFCKENSEEVLSLITEFDSMVFNEKLNLLDCKMEYFHDFGKTILACSEGQITEIDLEEE